MRVDSAVDTRSAKICGVGGIVLSEVFRVIGLRVQAEILDAVSVVLGDAHQAAPGFTVLLSMYA
ncbi:hypothetical protein [Gordonia otitidis]|uniref:hypothetical protein n=1 Tax=Gordonia otitidis TaxID=249058 RepID=UPI0002E1EC6E|nr:hypothetical protein [Gordonia otitidis]